jgi:hypothetical protein
MFFIIHLMVKMDNKKHPKIKTKINLSSQIIRKI